MKNDLKSILEMMSKIDSTYTSKSSLNESVFEGEVDLPDGHDAETDDTSIDTETPADSSQSTYGQTSKTFSVQDGEDNASDSMYDIKHTRRSPVEIDNGMPVTYHNPVYNKDILNTDLSDDKYTENDGENESTNISDFASESYTIDTVANLNKVEQILGGASLSDVNPNAIFTKTNSNIELLGPDDIKRYNDNEKALGHILGSYGGMSSDRERMSQIDYYNRNFPDRDWSSLGKNDWEKINADEREKNLGTISNLQAYWLANGGLVSVGQEETAVGVLSNLPQSFNILRSISYATYRIEKKSSMQDKLIFLRKLIYDGNIVKSLNFNYKLTQLGKKTKLKAPALRFNPFYDDPLSNLTVEEKLGNASYVLNYILQNNEFIQNNIFSEKKKQLSAIKNDFTIDGESFGSANNKGAFYSLFDYIYQIFVSLCKEDNRDRAIQDNDADFTKIYKARLKSYYALINNMLSSGLGNLLKVIPMTDMMDPTIKAEDYLNNILKNTGNKRDFLIIEGFLRNEKRLKKNGLFVYEEDKANLSIEKHDITLEEFFNRVVGNNNSNIQSEIIDSIRDLSDNRIEVEEEMNRYSVDANLKKLIGIKSVDIALKGKTKNLAIEYQGEQHYVPSCVRGLNAKDSSISNGRTSFYVSDSNSDKVPDFLKKDDFQERMECLMEEAKKASGKDGVYGSDSLMDAVWDYLTSLMENGLLNKDTYDNDKNGNVITNRHKSEYWSMVTDVNSRRRWYQEFLVYMQQAADKHKFLALTQNGWDFYYVCPSRRTITWNEVYNAGRIKYATQLSLFKGRKSGRVYNVNHDTGDMVDDNGNHYVNGLNEVYDNTAEIANFDKNNPAYFTFRYSTDNNLGAMRRLCNESQVLADVINEFIKEQTGI